MLYDTHTHMDGLAGAEGGWAGVLARAEAAGVSRLLAMGGSEASNRTALEAARAWPGRVRAAAGFNRDQAGAEVPWATLDALLREPEVEAIGEIGLDFQRGRQDAAAQCALFERMLDRARAARRPVCVHMRGAEPETRAALRAHAAAWRGPADRIGVLHCFTGSEDFARTVLDLGFMISFSGILTFKNAGAVRAVAAFVPEDRLLIETDSPYLAPEPHRGRPNEPARLRLVAEALARLRGLSWVAAAELTARNADLLFPLHG